MSTARARGEGPGGRMPAMVRRSVATIIAVATLVVGGLLGYVARGGPDAPSELTITQPLPTVTVTVPR